MIKVWLFFVLFLMGFSGKVLAFKDTVLFINAVVGPNFVSNPQLSSMGYSIDLTESITRPGFYFGFGLEARLKKKIGIHALGFIQTFGHDGREFYDQLELRNPGMESLGNKNDYSYGLYGDTGFGFSGSISYFINAGKLQFDPYFGVGIHKVTDNRIRYTLRQSGTNYFEKYLIKTESEKSIYYNMGSNVAFKDFNAIGLNLGIGFAPIKREYAIQITNQVNEVILANESANFSRFYFHVGVILRPAMRGE